MKLPSTKKTMGVLGSLCMNFISIYASIKDVTLVPSILMTLGVYYAALFGIKKYGQKKDGE